jgi:hypothetical protein
LRKRRSLSIFKEINAYFNSNLNLIPAAER